MICSPFATEFNLNLSALRGAYYWLSKGILLSDDDHGVRHDDHR